MANVALRVSQGHIIVLRPFFWCSMSWYRGLYFLAGKGNVALMDAHLCMRIYRLGRCVALVMMMTMYYCVMRALLAMAGLQQQHNL